MQPQQDIQVPPPAPPIQPPVDLNTPLPPPINGPQTLQSERKNKKAKLGIIALVITLIIGGSAAAYLGFVAPNKPENIWKDALRNTSEGYNRLVSYVEKDEQLKDLKGVKAKGSFKVQGPDVVDGSFESISFESNSLSKMSVGFKGARIDLEARTIAAAGTTTPDFYFKASGIRGLDALLGDGSSGFQPVLNSLDNQWISVDHTLIDQLEQEVNSRSGQRPTLSKEDSIKVARTFGEVNKEYLFSDAPDKRVLNVVKEVGKENRDGRQTYHFKVGANRDNLKKYVEALQQRLADTELRQLAGDSYNKWFVQLIEEIDSAKKGFGPEDTADVWVDMNTKLIRFVRFTDPDKDRNYFEIGLLYNGGDEFPLVLNLTRPDDQNPGDGRLTTTLNTGTDAVNVDLVFNYQESGQAIKVTGNLTYEPNTQPVQVEKPLNAMSILEVMSLIFGGSLPSGRAPSTSPTLLSNPIFNL